MDIASLFRKLPADPGDHFEVTDWVPLTILDLDFD